MSHQTLELETRGPLLQVRLNRPDVHNAFDSNLIAELTSVFAGLPGSHPGARVVVLSGNGKSFCAGADIQMMKKAVEMTRDENLADARVLAGLFRAINDCPLPVIGRAHGAALGGGMGLLACCDIVVADAACKFGFTETKLGILPAVISPFVVAKIGLSAARAHFTTGARFDAAEALRIGLVHQVVTATAGAGGAAAADAAESAAALDIAVGRVAAELLTAAPGAVSAAKELLRRLDVPNLTDSPEVAELTARAIAERRASAEGQEGLRAFLERRKPGWFPE